MNPFSEKPIDLEASLTNWKDMYPKAYDKNETDPYTKTRIILICLIQIIHQPIITSVIRN